MQCLSTRALKLLTATFILASCEVVAGKHIATLCSGDDECQELENLSSIFSYLISASISEVNVTLFTSFSLAENVVLDDPRFENVSISFIGVSKRETVIISCLRSVNHSSTGFYFGKIGSISLIDVTIENCGLLKKIDTYNYSLTSALYFVSCLDITLRNITVRNSRGSGISLLNNRGNVEISDSSFKGNKFSTEFDKDLSGGNGVYVNLTDTHNSSLSFLNCNFMHNNAGLFTDDHAVNSGQGGGVFLIINGTSSGNIITIDTSVVRGNTAVWGGGMYLLYSGKPEGNTITVTDTKIENNFSSGENGGGVDIGFVLFYGEHSGSYTDNFIRFERCNFTSNRATLYGGGTAIFATRVAWSDPDSYFMTFEGCLWEDNTALAGSAVDVSPSIAQFHINGVFPRPKFIDCTFRLNKLSKNVKTLDENVAFSISGAGTVLVTGFRLQFRGRTLFFNNSGSGLYVSSGTVQLFDHSITEFIANKGNHGGAVTLRTFAKILIHDNASLSFVNNTANLHGGAIHFLSNDPHEYLNSTGCFIRRMNEEDVDSGIKFNFEGNKALAGIGNDVFASSAEKCGCKRQSKNELETFRCIGNVSAPHNFDLTTEEKNFDISSTSQPSILSSIIPGDRFYELPVMALDEYNKTRVLDYNVIQDEGSSNLVSRSSLVSQNMLQFKGQLNATVTLTLKKGMTGLMFNITSSNRCSPGYHLIEKKCQCEAENMFGVSHCESNHAYIYHGFWIGKCLDEICTSHCPLGFCTYNYNESAKDIIQGLHILPLDVADLDLFICGPTRTGVLCGSCRHNSSAFYHSYGYTCGDNSLCKYGLLLYIVSELLPLTIMFFAIIIFDIKFTAGSVNGFIFFAQVLDSIAIDANGAIVFQPWLGKLTSIHRFVYRTFNFDFFSIEALSFCLWKDATTLDVMVMKYATILYAVTLLVLLIIFMNTWKCKRLFSCWRPRTLQSSAKNGLTAFIVICYSQCARVSFQILSPGYLYSYGNTGNPKKVAFRRGDYELFHSDHLIYAIPAILMLFVMSLVPFFLIVYPLIFKMLALCNLSESKLANIISRLLPIPLLDSFQSSFKDNFRFFAGLYFLYRLVALAAYAYSKTLIHFYTLVELNLILILALHSVVQPYKVKWHNTIDSLIFSNLAIINGITIFDYFKFLNGNTSSDRKLITLYSSLQALLIYIPLFCVIVYFFVVVFRKCKAYFVVGDISNAAITESVQLPPLRGEEDDRTDNRTQALLSEYTYGV